MTYFFEQYSQKRDYVRAYNSALSYGSREPFAEFSNPPDMNKRKGRDKIQPHQGGKS